MILLTAYFKNQKRNVMSKLSDYIVCSDPNLQALRTNIMALIKIGYIPSGSLIVVSNNGTPTLYLQPMVK